MENRVFLPDATPTTSDQPLSIYVPIEVMLTLLDESMSSLRTSMASELQPDERLLAEAMMRQREQFRERVCMLEATGETHIFMSMYPKSPYAPVPDVPDDYDAAI